MAEIMSRPFTPAPGFCWACVFGGDDHEKDCPAAHNHDLHRMADDGCPHADGHAG